MNKCGRVAEVGAFREPTGLRPKRLQPGHPAADRESFKRISKRFFGERFNVDPIYSLHNRAREALQRKDDASAEILLRELIQKTEEERIQDSIATWAFTALAKLARRRKDFSFEISLLEQYFMIKESPPFSCAEFDLVDRLEDAREGQRRYVAERGTCEKCHARNRVLTRVESGQVVCTTCFRTFGVRTKQDRVSGYHRNYIQTNGFEAPPDITKEEAKRLMGIIDRRHFGLPDDATHEEYVEALRRASFHKQFHTKVRGVTFTDVDGTSRQSIIAKCVIGERLLLVREPDNPHDHQAVKVCRETGELIGYLGEQVAGSAQDFVGVARQIDEGRIAIAVIATISPVDDSESPVFAVVIEITIDVPEVLSADS